MDDRNPVEPAPEPNDSDSDSDSDSDADDEAGAGQPSPEREQPERLADGNYVGENNIREGHVGGVIGGAHQQGGEGGGG